MFSKVENRDIVHDAREKVQPWRSRGRHPGKGKQIMKKKVFWPEYMRKRRPKVPGFLCSSYVNYLLGIISPSLVFRAIADERTAAETKAYLNEAQKFLCWQRRLSREEWKNLHRFVRVNRKRQQE